LDETVKGKFNQSYHGRPVMKLTLVLKRCCCGRPHRLHNVVRSGPKQGHSPRSGICC
jgi:hypothetical protein